jgi:hypothetical protein
MMPLLFAVIARGEENQAADASKFLSIARRRGKIPVPAS